MAKKKIKIDGKKFMKMIGEGYSKKEIMDTFGINTYTQFDSKYNQVAIELGMIPAPKGRTSKKTKINMVVKVNKRGSLIIPKKITEELKFKEDDEFDVRKSKSGISFRLRKGTET